MILEAWCYTRAVWGEILEAWYDTRAVQGWSWRPGIPPGWCMRGPRGLVLRQGGWDRCDPRATTGWIPTAARGVDLQGVVIKYWGSMMTAATGIQMDWYTGIQVDWYTGIL